MHVNSLWVGALPWFQTKPHKNVGPDPIPSCLALSFCSWKDYMKNAKLKSSSKQKNACKITEHENS